MANNIEEVLSRYPLGSSPLGVFSYEPPVAYGDVAELIKEGVNGSELRDLWSVISSARLFEDEKYGQWGLWLFSPSECRSRTLAEISNRPEDFNEGDLVIGSFLGDSDLLLYSQGDEGCRVRVALPLYDRPDWYEVGRKLSTFLSDYLEHSGEKYWE